VDAVKTRICSDKSLRSDFARCVTLFKDFVKQNVQTSKAQLGIAALKVNDGGGGGRSNGRTPGTPWKSGVLFPRMS
jgi:hypothetical protein